MDRRVFSERIQEQRVIDRLLHNRKLILYMNNCGGHHLSHEVLTSMDRINTEVFFLPKDSTDLVQQTDPFIIQKVKQVWRKHWDAWRMEATSNGAWKEGSGKLPNPGKNFFLKMAAGTTRDVNAPRDADGISYGRKAMIRCGMSLNLNGRWEVQQLFQKLQEIVRKYEAEFNGIWKE